MKLRIVDDEKDLLDQLRKTLTHQRYDVDTAADGDVALDKLFENPYDLVVLDIMLPKTDGLTVLREMRAAGILTPVIMLTAKGAVEDKVKVLENKEGVYISLFNTGAGIPKTDIGRVFEQFYRVETSRSTQYGGSNLGLSIAKWIIELHGGRIEIESELSAWTRINICFPKLVFNSFKSSV
jgi:CheY-like chemotaxis protein